VALALKVYAGEDISVGAGSTVVFKNNLDWSKVKKIWVSIKADGASTAARKSLVHFYQTGTTIKVAPSCCTGFRSETEDNVLDRRILDGMPLDTAVSDFISCIATCEDNTDFAYIMIYAFPREFATSVDIVLENGDTTNATTFDVMVVVLET